MSDSVSSVLLHPVRLRIAQHLALHTQATVRQLGEALPDVPAASLYRHLRRMTELGVLEVVREMPGAGVQWNAPMPSPVPPLWLPAKRRPPLRRSSAA